MMVLGVESRGIGMPGADDFGDSGDAGGVGAGVVKEHAVADLNLIQPGRMFGINNYVPQLATAVPGMRVIKSGRTTGVTTGTVTAVNVDQKWAEPNRDVVVRFLRGLQRGRNYIRTNPQETAKIAAEELRSDVTLTARMLVDIEKYGMLDPETAVNYAGLKRVHETLQKTGDVPMAQPFDMKIFTDLSYYEQSREPVATGTIPRPR